MLVDNTLINRVMSYPLDHVLTRYAQDEQISMETATEHERELKRFLTLCSLNPDASYGMKGPVDNLWHTFIMFTKDYSDFCNNTSGRFIHHVPETRKFEGNSPAQSSDNYIRFLEDYEEVFGENPPVHLWPRIRKSESSSDISCSSCNGCKAVEPANQIGCSGCSGCSVGE